MKKLLFVLCLGFTTASGQALLSQTPPSPNAAALGRFGETPVNLSNGTISPTIPLFNLDEYGMPFQVSLNYNYMGFRPSEMVGITGMGWNLTAGGVVTRVINGQKDESPEGYYFKASQTRTAIETYVNTGVKTSHFQLIEQGVVDGEPDMFHFNFGAYSGSFFWGWDGKFHLNSQQKLKIEVKYDNLVPLRDYPLHNAVQQNFTAFTITTEEGTAYTFSHCEFSRSTTSQVNNTTPENSNSGRAISAWYLSEIKGSNGQYISFEYTLAPQNPNRIQPSILEEKYKRITSGGTENREEIQMVMNLSHEIFLQNIKGNGWKIELGYQNFTGAATISGYTNQTKKLTSIELYDLQNTLSVKKYLFDYHNFNDNFWLKSIQETDPVNQTLPAYLLDYYGGSSRPIVSRGLDHFGFYNGKITNPALIPGSGVDRNPDLQFARTGALSMIRYPTGGMSKYQYSLNDYSPAGTPPAYIDSTRYYEVSGATVNYDPALSVTAPVSVDIAITITNGAGSNCDIPPSIDGHVLSPKPANVPYHLSDLLDVLETYINCAGAQIPPLWRENIQLNVTAHYPYVHVNPPGPGIRISSVIHSDTLGLIPAIQKTYEYRREDPLYSSGEIFGIPFYNNWVSGTGIIGEYLSSNSFHGMSGLPVNYQRVTEKVNNVVQSVYYFTSQKEDLYQNDLGLASSNVSATNLIGPFSDYGAMRGKVKKHQVYNTTLLKDAAETSFGAKSLYTSGNTHFFATPGLYLKKLPDYTAGTYTFVLGYGKVYNAVSFWFYPQLTKQMSYDETGANPVTSTTELFFENQNHYQLTRQKHINSDGIVREEKFKYPLDYSTVVGRDPVIDSLINHHRANTLLEHTISTGQVLDATAYTFAMHPGNSRKTNLFLPDKVYRFQATGAFVPYSGLLGGINPASYYENLAYIAYDTLGQVLQTRDAAGLNMSAVRAYKAMYPVSIISNAQKADVDAALSGAGTSQNALRNVANATTLGNALTALQSSLTQAHVNGYLYQPLVGLTYSLKPNGFNTRFEYDSFERLSAVKNQEGNLTQLFEYQLRGIGTSLSNHIVTRDLRIPTTTASEAGDHLKATTRYEFFDAMGRPWQSVSWRQSPQAFNILTSSRTYDAAGRTSREYLPAPNGLTGTVSVADPNAVVNGFYGDNGFTTMEYYGTTEAAKSVLKPGSLWSTNNKKIQYTYGTAGASVRKYTINSSNDISVSGTFPAYELTITTTVDEQGNTVITYKDKRGLLIESWQQTGPSDYAVTHYIYDGLDRARAVIQPEGYALNASMASGSAAFAGFVFCYEYDARGRQVRKHIPAAGWTEIVFDKAARPVMEQNALQKTANKWTFMQYDVFGRQVTSGETVKVTTRAAAQALFDSHTTPYENRSGASYNGASFPAAVKPVAADIMLFNYYDDYTFAEAAFAFVPAGAFHTQKTTVKGLMTGSKKRNSGDPARLNTDVLYYDAFNRVIQSQHTTIKSTGNTANILIRNFEYNFANEVIKEEVSNPFPAATVSVKQHSQYDHAGRLTRTDLGINQAPEETIRYTYDEIGRLTQKKYMPNGTYSTGLPDFLYRSSNPASNTQDRARKAIFIQPNTVINATTVGSYIAKIDTGSAGAAVSGLQTMNYSWHLRGWLRGINLNASGDAIPDGTQNDLFAFKLDYETAGQWNGNIGRQTWNHVDGASPVGLRNYLYTYDKADRLKTAVYGGLAGEDYTTPDISYDKNGNILTMQRKGKVSAAASGPVDQLSYTYSGNRLNAVSDAVTGNDNTGDFRDVAGSTDYTYWENGSLKSDANRGISLIEYHTFLSKVSKITWTDGRWIQFTYDGAGELLKRENSTGEVWEYAQNFIFKNNQFNAAKIPDGRAIFEGGAWKYEFEYRDVWNNLRVSFGAEGDKLVKKQQSDYDALGYEYNQYTLAATNFFKYQNQERVEDFGLNVDFFKFRSSDPTIGRFWEVDPLATDYVYNSPYALQENKFGLGVELEGRELIPFTSTLVSSSSAVVRPITIPYGSSLRIPVIPNGSTLAPISSSQEHHIIPNAHKKHPLVKEARNEGFKQDGKENKTPLEKYDKETGEGRHGNHPNYNEYVKQKLDNYTTESTSSSKPSLRPSDFVRQLVKELKMEIQNNPSIKLNDLFKPKNIVIPSDNTSIKLYLSPTKINPCAGSENCL